MASPSPPRRSTVLYISARDSLIKELGFSVEFIDRCTKHSTPFLSAKRLYLLAAAATHWGQNNFEVGFEFFIHMLHPKILWDYELIWHRLLRFWENLLQLHKRFGPIVNGFGSETPIYHRRDLVCILRKPGESQNVTYVHLYHECLFYAEIYFFLSPPLSIFPWIGP